MSSLLTESDDNSIGNTNFAILIKNFAIFFLLLGFIYFSFQFFVSIFFLIFFFPLLFSRQKKIVFFLRFLRRFCVGKLPNEFPRSISNESSTHIIYHMIWEINYWEKKKKFLQISKIFFQIAFSIFSRNFQYCQNTIVVYVISCISFSWWIILRSKKNRIESNGHFVVAKNRKKLIFWKFFF